MKKVVLTMEKQKQYEIIKALHEGTINKNRAVVRLGVTRRHVNRLLARYAAEGKKAFIHGNTGRKPAHAFSLPHQQAILSVYNQKYFDANCVHASQLMAIHDSIHISPSALRKLLLSADILSPKAKRTTRHALHKRLSAQSRNTTAPTQQRAVESKILSVKQSHSRRSRSAYFGEMIQMDASLHPWFGSEKSQLHIAIDDATGRILAAWFDRQETLHAYYQLLYQILTTEGIPYLFFTDNRTVFTYKKKKSPSEKEDVSTQFSYACKQLGIEIRTSSIAQAKGRVERAFQTLQSRLPIELRLANITDMEQANLFLNSYIKEFNSQFSLPVDYTKSVFVEQPPEEKIHQILAVLAERTIDCGQCIRYDNKHYKVIDRTGLQINFRRGTKGLLAKTFRDELFFTVADSTYALEEVPVHAVHSKIFDILPTQKPATPHIPPSDHPWRQAPFHKHRKYIASKYYLEV